eukprot:COSAG04_NODE_30413_length_263_cov_0.567073_1_plen_32_part_01
MYGSWLGQRRVAVVTDCCSPRDVSEISVRGHH